MGNIEKHGFNVPEMAPQKKLVRPQKNEPTDFVAENIKEYQISPETNKAVVAYAGMQVSWADDAIAFDDAVTRLEQKGVRYRYERASIGNYIIEVLDEKLNPVKRYDWCGGKSKEKFSGCTYFKYANGREVENIYNGKDVCIRTKIFYNDLIAQEYFTDEGFTYQTTPQDYIACLEKNNVKYKIDTVELDGKLKEFKIKEYDIGGKKTREVSWSSLVHKNSKRETTPPSICYFNAKNEKTMQINFTAEKTELVEFLKTEQKNSQMNIQEKAS